jgi:hypothetical protein
VFADAPLQSYVPVPTTQPGHRVLNGLLLLFVAGSGLAGLRELGVSDPLSLVLLTTGLGAVAARRIQAPPPARACTGHEALFFGAAVLSRILLGIAAERLPHGLSPLTIHLPVYVRAAGAMLLLAVIARPFWIETPTGAGSSSAAGAPPGIELSRETLVYAASVPMVSGNLVLAALAMAWIGGACLLQRGAAPVRSRQEGVLVPVTPFGIR